jgi:hypothetical protein
MLSFFANTSVYYFFTSIFNMFQNKLIPLILKRYSKIIPNMRYNKKIMHGLTVLSSEMDPGENRFI